MSSEVLKNKIEADDTSISKLLKDQKFFIDYFQREYRWQEKHIRQLIEDLTDTFLKSYKDEDERPDVGKYQNYYLGPVVFSINTDNGKMSIIDGQQRITSITLLLIYLNNLQNKFNKEKVEINQLIYSEKYGQKSFNMSDETREECLKNLYSIGNYTPNVDDDETIKNMVARYEDISNSFPDEIDEKKLPFFIDWLIDNVVLVNITTYSDENAYTIFETMNDRGLNLTSTEMLKSFILSRITNKDKRLEINDIWKLQIQKLHEIDETADQSFFQAWFRGKFALSIRPGKAGSIDQDFELIGSRFHNWFKDNYKDIFHLTTSDNFYHFFKSQFPYFVGIYILIKKSTSKYDNTMPHLNYLNYWGIGESLQEPLLLSPINFNDDESLYKNKIDFVARYIETFTVRRAVNYRKFSQSSIKYTMFTIIKLIRDNDLYNLSANIINEIDRISEKWDGVEDFRLHGQNGRFIKHLLSRVTSFIDNLTGKTTTYETYHHPNGKQFEIEHIWADKFSDHRDEFDQENEFKEKRNSIGALLLLPNGTNQSFNSDLYEDKLKHYLKENTFAQTLHQDFYIKNPNFLTSPIIKKLVFKPHPQYKIKDIDERQDLFQRICEEIWSTEYFRLS